MSRSPHIEQATELIQFLTDEPAQKALAAHGLAPTRVSAYGDPTLTVLFPHLSALREAVEKARPRPIHPNYRAFARVVRQHAEPLLYAGAELSLDFISGMKNALS